MFLHILIFTNIPLYASALIYINCVLSAAFVSPRTNIEMDLLLNPDLKICLTLRLITLGSRRIYKRLFVVI